MAVAAGARAGKRPPSSCYTQARLNEAVAYERVLRSLAQLKGCLAAGFPFVFGFTVYESFESDGVAADRGRADAGAGRERARRPRGARGRLRRRHGALPRPQLLGSGWGKGGYFTLPYAYLTETGLSQDFWTVRVVS